MNDPIHPQDHTQIACATCNYNLTGLDLTGSCPECGNTIITTCFNCDYELVGVNPAGPCPECGYLIEDSIGLGALSRCCPETLARLHNGVILIQAAVIAWLMNIFAGAILGGIYGARGQPLTPSINIALSIVLGFISLTFILGWWKFVQIDASLYSTPKGASAQRFVRTMLVIFAVTSVLNLLSNFLPQSFYNSVVGSIATFGFLLLMLVVIFTFFIAQMLYLQSIAPLILNKKVYSRSKYMIWLGPILMTVGALVILLGPLVAIILYWNMLDWIRKDLKSIRQSHHAIA